MAYTKTTWQNNVTDIDENNLNKMEQGIYDNSLVVEAVTNTLNPTDTETYKTAELIEGQITDVIGVNDILIKGQTSQDGTPTPSAPVDVNVVSGSNVINTSNKNLLNINNAIAFRACTIQLQNNSIKIITDGTNNAIVKIPCVLTAGNYYLHFEGNANIVNVAFYNLNGEKIIANNPSSSKAITLSDNLAYININLSNVAGTYTLAFNKLYINLGSTDLSYEPHQSKELHLDLGKNLFNKDNYLANTGINSDGTIATSNNNSLFYIPIKYEKKYTISFVDNGVSENILYGFSNDKPVLNGTCTYNVLDITTLNNHTFTPVNANNKYLCIRLNVANTNQYQAMENIQVELGSEATKYVPYDPNPIELCKIGNYQDYFYKSGSKWYLHKEINKKTLDGTENWEYQNSHRFIIRGRVFNEQNKPILASSNSAKTGILSTHSNEITPNETYSQTTGSEGISYLSISEEGIAISCNSIATTTADFKTWLANNLPSVYYILKTSRNIEITDTTLISQLEAIYNAPLYEQTNITQTNNDLPMVLDITACKDNINGIKAFIRK